MLHQQIQNYKIVSLLGEGGMANVYLGKHIKLNKKVAIKVLKDSFGTNKNLRNRFISEAKSLACLNHPNIIKVYDFIEQDGIVAFIMEYIEGYTLGELIEKKGKFKDEEIKEIFSQMLIAVSFIHEKGLIHRDIKPSNFMVKPDGMLVLLDFGIAKHFTEIGSEHTATGTFQTMGTPIYMSLEQFSSTKDVSKSSDIYSLGIILWFILTGKKPFSNNDNIGLVELIELKKKKLPLTNTKWDKIIQPMTQPHLTKRFKHCNEVSDFLPKVKFYSKRKMSFEFLKNIKIYFTKYHLVLDRKLSKMFGVSHEKVSLVNLFLFILAFLFFSILFNIYL